jgi:hypothetical protein
MTAGARTSVLHLTALTLIATLVASTGGPMALAKGVEPNAVADIPVTEVTVFKDGHAFVLHEGRARTDADGNVVLDYLPVPVVGTFWPYSADEKVELTGVESARRAVPVRRTALSVREMLEANVGARVRVRERGRDDEYEATVAGLPTRSTEELAAAGPPGAPERLPEKGDIVLLETREGTKVLPIADVERVVFLDNPKPEVEQPEFRNILSMRLDWGSRKPAAEADVGMAYLQRGIRWIPSYRVEVDGRGKAVVRLQATLINELADLEDVTANLVIGVPTFAFMETPDPISLQESVAQLSSAFRADSRTAFAFSNAIMSQTAMMPRGHRGSGSGDNVIDLGPDVGGSGKNEDLYVFTLENVTLAKGHRMVVPVAEFTLDYEDVYVLDLPFSPPPEVRHRFNSDRQAELARMFSGPEVVHKIRLANDSAYPLTTAPALVLRGGWLLAQNMMTYTAVGGRCDLAVTTAVDIAANRSDTETSRTPNAANWHGHSCDRTDLTGTISLTNHFGRTVQVEVSRSVLGTLDSASGDGDVRQMSWIEDGFVLTDGLPHWWYWYSWPGWWYHLNSVGRVTWTLEIKPGHTVDLEYTWHYFWG